MSHEEAFELTVGGKMSYNSNHPYYYDAKFYNKLLEYYAQKEEYEVCAELVRRDNSK